MEFYLLEVLVDEMEARGLNKNLVRLNLDDSFAEKISEKMGSPVAMDVIRKRVDRCLANEWLEHKEIGGGRYSGLGLTTTGIGLVRSRQRKEALLAERSFLKRSSDYIEGHKGLFVALAIAIALAGLLVRLFVR